MGAVIEPAAIPTQRPPLPVADNCILIIFGATGDLNRRKLMPAVYALAQAGCMRPQFDIVGTGRTPLTDAEFRKRMKEAVAASGEAKKLPGDCWSNLEPHLFYVRGDAHDPAFYPVLKQKLEELRKKGASANHLFYISTQASLAGPIVENLGSAGLAKNEAGWARIVLEKPFGNDLVSAQALNATVRDVFPERDVFRIDHYLGKETVQNIVMFRFGNSLFEPVWNRNYVESVEITAAETLGVESRGDFYEETGALRDMVANHMLQLLALTAMEPPVAFDADSVREQKVQVFRSIRPMKPEDVAKYTVRGQYGPGMVDGSKVPGYREEKGVKADSRTETYVAVEFHIDNWRWAGVPFFIRTGKRLKRRMTEIAVRLKRTPHALFAHEPSGNVGANVITLRIQPNEGISISFGAKAPGWQMQAAPVLMDFSYDKAFGTNSPAAYETLLLDAMRGDATLFTRADEVESEWKIITPIEEAWAKMPVPQFPNYAAGSEGPQEAERLVRELGHGWRELG